MKCYNHPGISAITTCSVCNRTICEVCYCKDKGWPVCQQCLNARSAYPSHKYVNRALVVVLFLIFFIAAVILVQSFLNTNRKLISAYNETSASNLWAGHRISSPGETEEQVNEAQLKSGMRGPVLEIKLTSGEIGYLHPFRNLAELKQFLSADQTDKHDYGRDFDCDDFAFLLSKNAISKGYQIFPFAEGSHLKNVAHVYLGKDATAVYTVEPQTDEISLWGRVD